MLQLSADSKSQLRDSDSTSHLMHNSEDFTMMTNHSSSANWLMAQQRNSAIVTYSESQASDISAAMAIQLLTL